jgi:hypothetical protein
MSDQILIYLIVLLNVICQLMLIWRQKLSGGVVQWKLISLAVAIPLIIMVIMRILIANGIIHGHISEQSFIEQSITKGTSILLIAGPWLVTFAAVMAKVKNRTLLKEQAVIDSPI